MLDRSSMKTLQPKTVLALILLAGCSNGGGHGGLTSTVAPAVSGAAPVTSAAPVVPATPLFAGASRVDVTPPLGVPLAGYGGGDRRHPFPNLNPNDYDHFLRPSTGQRDPICARALYISDGKTAVTFVALDAIATTNECVLVAWAKARAQGATVPLENLMVCSSHTHSGPGCLTTLWMWELIAADLYNDSVFQTFTDGIARAIVLAEKNAVPARIGAGAGSLPGCTHNRRAGVSPVFLPDSVDPEVLVLRVDGANGDPIATLWNYAIHGTALGPTSHDYSADIMGGVNAELEARKQGVALFLNSGEGDISPVYSADTGIKQGGKVMADEIVSTRAKTPTLASLEVVNTSEVVDLGDPTFDVSLQRMGSQGAQILAHNGWLQFLAQAGVNLGVKIQIPRGWCEREFRFQAVRLGKWGFSSIPGEAIHTITTDLKARGLALGYERLFTCGLANGHASYVTTEPEYNAGGYEAISTLFGSHTADRLTDACDRQITKTRP